VKRYIEIIAYPIKSNHFQLLLDAKLWKQKEALLCPRQAESVVLLCQWRISKRKSKRVGLVKQDLAYLCRSFASSFRSYVSKRSRSSGGGRGRGSRGRGMVTGRKSRSVGRGYGGGKRRKVVQSRKRGFSTTRRPSLWPKGTPKAGPVDKLIVTLPSLGDASGSNSQGVYFNAGVLTGKDIGTILTNIRSEAISTLTGGANLYQPTLYVRALQLLKVFNAGNANIHGSYQICSFRANASYSLTGVASLWDGDWAKTFDISPTTENTYPLWPTTKISENKFFFSNDIFNKVGREVSFKIPAGRSYTIKHNVSRKLTFADYESSVIGSSLGGVPKATTFVILRLHGEVGQLCGTLSAASTPILGPVSCAYIMQGRTFYQYKWAAGNNRPSVYGHYLATNEGVDRSIAIGWVGVPALKSMRIAAGDPNLTPAAAFGALDPATKHEANINPIKDCAGDAFVPVVDGAL